MTAIGVLHIIDTLSVGGAEQMAVNAVNHMPRQQYRPFLCTSRRQGPLGDHLAPDVPWLKLERTGRFDFGAISRLRRFIRDNDIRVIHAHSTSLFLAVATARGARVVWHDHGQLGRRPEFLYRQATRHADAVVTVSRPLLNWTVDRLRFPRERAWYIPNFPAPRPAVEAVADLPGTPGARIVCVANFRPEKDHLNLLDAMSIVLRYEPKAHLLLVGESRDQPYFERVKYKARYAGNVSFLGPRLDVAGILAGCDIGVLSSRSEGLPLALIEYGTAGLPVVTTAVGQMAEVVDAGNAGILIEPEQPLVLANALVELLRCRRKRDELGATLRRRVTEIYSPENIMRQICAVYSTVLNS